MLVRRGRPVAAVVPLADEDYFSIRLASDPRFIQIIERSRASYKARGGISMAELRKRRGLEPKRRRRTAGKLR